MKFCFGFIFFVGLSAQAQSVKEKMREGLLYLSAISTFPHTCPQTTGPRQASSTNYQIKDLQACVHDICGDLTTSNNRRKRIDSLQLQRARLISMHIKSFEKEIAEALSAVKFISEELLNIYHSNPRIGDQVPSESLWPYINIVTEFEKKFNNRKPSSPTNLTKEQLEESLQRQNLIGEIPIFKTALDLRKYPEIAILELHRGIPPREAVKQEAWAISTRIEQLKTDKNFARLTQALNLDSRIVQFRTNYAANTYTGSAKDLYEASLLTTAITTIVGDPVKYKSFFRAPLRLIQSVEDPQITSRRFEFIKNWDLSSPTASREKTKSCTSSFVDAILDLPTEDRVQTESDFEEAKEQVKAVFVNRLSFESKKVLYERLREMRLRPIPTAEEIKQQLVSEIRKLNSKKQIYLNARNTLSPTEYNDVMHAIFYGPPAIETRPLQTLCPDFATLKSSAYVGHGTVELQNHPTATRKGVFRHEVLHLLFYPANQTSTDLKLSFSSQRRIENIQNCLEEQNEDSGHWFEAEDFADLGFGMTNDPNELNPACEFISGSDDDLHAVEKDNHSPPIYRLLHAQHQKFGGFSDNCKTLIHQLYTRNPFRNCLD